MRLTQILRKARWDKEIGAVGEMTEKYSNLPRSYIKRTMRQVKFHIFFFSCLKFLNINLQWNLFRKQLDWISNTT